MNLSIIVPVYNMAADGKLDYCLNSLVRQTIRDYEIIAVDDASTDSSPEILRRFQEEYPDRFVCLTLPENHRQGGAKNAALEICKGEYVGFVDSDDWVTPDMYERLWRAARDQDADIAVCDLCLVREHTMEPAERVPAMRLEDAGEMTKEKVSSLIHNSGALVTKIYKRDLFFEPKLRFPEHMFYEDNAIGTELTCRAKKLVYLPEPMYFYYQHSSSTTHVITEERCRDRMEAMRIMLRLAKEGGYYETYLTDLEYKFTNLFYKNTLFSYVQGRTRVRLAFIRNLGKEMRDTFPDFQKNPKYVQYPDAEEKRLMALQQKSTVLFWLYYRLLWGARRLKGRLKKG